MSFCAGFDRVARNARHFLEVLDELAIAELEKSLIVERVKAGMRRARLEGRRWAVRRLSLTGLQLCLTALLD
jgi:hypothetical protein